MGQHQSSEERPGSGGEMLEDVKICYYKLLEIQPQASDDEIKKAYRRKALELHPDRNYGKVEESTQLFADVQTAYEILSDPQERAWYDSHRDTILSNKDPQAEDHYEHNLRLTTAEDIMQMFMNFNGQLDYSDNPSGFYSSLRSVFATLAREESVACEWEGLNNVDYPSFGSSTDTYDSTVKTFYSAWNSFWTKKTFSWKDVFRYSEAPDRKVRRMMEKENKRFRDESVKEFNEAVRALVAFVKKRDPRYVPNRQTEAERLQTLRNKVAAQAARSRAANQANLKQDGLPHWASVKTPEEVQIGADESEEDLEPQEKLVCVLCKKSFKSEKQWEAHEKSKKHFKSIQHLRRKMRKEDKVISLSHLEHKPQGTTSASSDEEEEEAGPEPVSSVNRLIEDEEEPTKINGKTPVIFTTSALPDVKETDCLKSSISSLETGEEYALWKEVGKRYPGGIDLMDSATASPLHRITNSDHILRVDGTLSMKQVKEGSNLPSMGKAKEKRLKKAAQKTPNTTGAQPEFICASCMTGFPSKTQLFNHIKDFNHAAPATKAAQGKKAKKAKNR